MASLGARLVVAGTRSGVGKTTVATGLLAALRAAGHRVANAKVGPDFIDPGYHALAAGRPARNLDPWLCGPEAIGPLAGRAAAGADLLVVEGVMGLFDGAADGTVSSTADVAHLLDAPVVLVVDVAGLAGSVAAIVHGFATLDPRISVAGVVLNRVASDGHEAMLRDALATLGVPVLGALRRDDRLTWRDRHLGLVPVAEDPLGVQASLARLAAAVAEGCDLAAIVAVARAAPQLEVGPVPLPAAPTAPAAHGAPVRIAVAGGRAFSFTYTDTIEALEAGGAEIVPFDPLADPALPEQVHGLLLGGGFPETFAAALADNRPLLQDLRRRVRGGTVTTWAECGGLLLLADELDGHAMAGALPVPVRARMTERLTLGYRTATTQGPSPLGAAGRVLRGHEFHYSTTEPGGGALALTSRWGQRLEGFATPTLLATYLHHHPGGDPSAVARFVAACAARATGSDLPSG